MSRNRWSKEDVERLIELRRDRTPWSDVAKALRREPASCQVKYSQLKAHGKIPPCTRPSRRSHERPIEVVDADEHESEVQAHSTAVPPSDPIVDEVLAESGLLPAAALLIPQDEATPSQRLVGHLSQALHLAVMGRLPASALDAIERIGGVYLKVLELNLKAMEMGAGGDDDGEE